MISFSDFLIYLAGNRIKSINSRLFDGLINLKEADLRDNKCIKKHFLKPLWYYGSSPGDRVHLSELPKFVIGRCNFTETTEDEETSNESSGNAKTERTFVGDINRIAILETRLTAAENQISLLKELSHMLDAQHNLTCAAKTAELIKTLEIKRREIDELLEEKQRNQAAINDKDRKIEELQKKLSTN